MATTVLGVLVFSQDGVVGVVVIVVIVAAADDWSELWFVFLQVMKLNYFRLVDYWGMLKLMIILQNFVLIECCENVL